MKVKRPKKVFQVAVRLTREQAAKLLRLATKEQITAPEALRKVLERAKE